jgi:hypothetical protein
MFTHHPYLCSYDTLKFILSKLRLPRHPNLQSSDFLHAGILHRNIVPDLHHAASISFLCPALPCVPVFHQCLQFSFRVTHSRTSLFCTTLLQFFFLHPALLRCHSSRLQFLYRVPRLCARIGEAQKNLTLRRRFFSSSAAAFPTSSRQFLIPGPSSIAPSSSRATYIVESSS